MAEQTPQQQRERDGEGEDNGKPDGGGGPPELDAAAETSKLGDRTAEAATEYFLGRKRRGPVEFWLDVDFGTLDEPDFQQVQFRTLRSKDVDEADKQAERKLPGGGFDGIDRYVRASWLFARACLQPRLGPLMEARNKDGAKLANAAQLVQVMWEDQPGVILQVEQELMRRSRIGGSDDDRAVKEVEAGKTSS